MGDLAGKVALVTGSSRGIGRAIADHLSQRGAEIIIHYTQDQKSAEELKEIITKRGGKAAIVRADVSKVKDIKHLFEETVKIFGGLDILVANAGIFSANAVVDVTEEEYDRVFGINAKGAFFTLQEGAKILREDGRIIYISSVLTNVPRIPQLSVYSGTKAAGEQFVKSLAVELAPKRITVNSISPGYTDTDMLPGAFHSEAAKASVFGRVGTAQEVAEVAGFLASSAGRWVTGSNLQVSGGSAMPQ